VAWSGDGRFLLATAPTRTLRFEFTVPMAARPVLHFSCPIRAAGFSPDGCQVVGLGEPPDAAEGRSWSLLRGPLTGGSGDLIPVAAAGQPSRPGLSVAADSGQVSLTRPGTGVLLFAPGKAVPVANLTPLVARCPRYAPDGSSVWAIVNGVSVVSWDAKTGAHRGTWDNSGAKIVSGLPDLEALAVGRSGAAVGGRDGGVRWLSARVERLALFVKPGDPVLAVDLSPDETLIAAGTRAGSVRLIRPSDGIELPEFAAHPGGVTAISFNPEGSLLATGGKDRAVRVWRRVGDGFEPIFATADLPTPVVGLEFAPTGNMLLVLLAHERTARLWDLDCLREQLGGLTLDW